MTLDEALALEPGDTIASPLDSPPYRIRRIPKSKLFPHIFVAADRSYVRVSLRSYRYGEWIDPRGFIRVPRHATGFDHDARRFYFMKKGGKVYCGKAIAAA